MVVKLNQVKNKLLFGFIAVWTLPFFIFWHNLKATKFNCFNSSDLGIYAQALYEIAAQFPFQLNPFITVRGIHIFNDHFDPIILLVAPLTRLFSFHIGGVLFIEILWVLLTMGLLAWQCKKAKHALYFLFLFVFCKGVLVALAFPVHPTTWSMFPCLLLGYFIVKDKPLAILGSAFLICLFREDFPFAVLGLSFAYLFRKKVKTFLALFILAVLFILFDFVWRPLLLGPTYAHGSGIFSIFMHSPFMALFKALGELSWGSVSMFYPFILPLLYLIHKEIGFSRNWKENWKENWKKMVGHPLWPIFFFLAPLLVIRLLAQAFQFHYTAPLVVMMLGLLATSSATADGIDRHPRWALFILLLFVLSSSSVYTKMVKLVFFDIPPKAKCIVGEEKRISTQKIMTSLDKELGVGVGVGAGAGVNLLSSGGIIPQILRPNLLIHHLGGLSLKWPDYDLLLLELGGSGDTWPYSEKQIAAFAERCRPFAKKIIQEDSYYLLMGGKFPRECVENKNL